MNQNNIVPLLFYIIHTGCHNILMCGVNSLSYLFITGVHRSKFNSHVEQLPRSVDLLTFTLTVSLQQTIAMEKQSNTLQTTIKGSMTNATYLN